MDKMRVVITGKGVVSPGCFTVKNFWDSIINKQNFIKKINKFDISSFPCKAGGVIEHFDRRGFGIKKHLADQMDISSLYGLVAAEIAHKDAGLAQCDYDRGKAGVFYGTNLGGRTFAERELYNLYTKGPEKISPYQAIADFNAATLGQISIRLGLKGHSKTFATDFVASHDAIIEAYNTVDGNVTDLALTGGVESVFSAFGFLCAVSSGKMSAVSENVETAYRPFDKNRTGMFAGEGAAFLVLEDFEHAVKRHATFDVEIKGYGRSSSPAKTSLEVKTTGLSRAIEKAIIDANLTIDEISYVKACGYATREDDEIEVQAIKRVFKERFSCLPITAPHSAFGHMQGAMGAFDLLVGTLSIENNQIPPTANYGSTDIDDNLNLVTDAITTEIKNVLIVAMGNGGTYSALVVGKIDKPAKQVTKY